jgi:hypothetical protein
VQEVYKRGLRHLQLQHERDDLVSPSGDVNTATADLGGLTAFGAEVVKECNRLGIVVDLAHASPETVLGALKASVQPIIVSNTSLDSRKSGNPRMAEMMRPLLISKEHAKVVTDADGVKDQQIKIWIGRRPAPPVFSSALCRRSRVPAPYPFARRQPEQAIHTAEDLRELPGERFCGVA